MLNPSYNLRNIEGFDLSHPLKVQRGANRTPREIKPLQGFDSHRTPNQTP